jgi:hypothetical protein
LNFDTVRRAVVVVDLEVVGIRALSFALKIYVILKKPYKMLCVRA